MITHADIDTTGTKNKSLCGLKGGAYVWQDIGLIGFDGRISAEINCGLCQLTGRLYGTGYSLAKARQIARK